MKIHYQYRAIIGKYHFALRDPKVSKNAWAMPGGGDRTTDELRALSDRLNQPFEIFARYPTNLVDENGD